jgi:UPF0716 protein FxsA
MVQGALPPNPEFIVSAEFFGSGARMWHLPGMGRLLVLFIVVPAVELALLIEIGSRIGTPATLGIIIVTGFVGAALARAQGLGVIRQMQRETAEGQLPADSLVDGAFILVAAALLVTPGVLTDAFGFLCLLPRFRAVAKRWIWRWLERAVRDNRVHMQVHLHPPFPGAEPRAGESGPRPDVVDVRPERVDDLPPRA